MRIEEIVSGSTPDDARDARLYRALRDALMRGKQLDFAGAYVRVHIIGDTPTRADFETMVESLLPSRTDETAATIHLLLQAA